MNEFLLIWSVASNEIELKITVQFGSFHFSFQPRLVSFKVRYSDGTSKGRLQYYSDVNCPAYVERASIHTK